MRTTTTHNNARLPCDRVLTLHELLEQVCLYLNDPHFKTSSLVCKDWNSLFAPFRWRKLVLWKDHPKQHILKQHGVFIRTLQLLHLDQPILKSITLFCTNVHTLTILLVYTTMWITYTDLENLFIHLQDTLTKCTIRIDVAYFSPTILWSLCRLRRLQEIHLDADDSKYDRLAAAMATWRRNAVEHYVGLLRCCPSLKAIVFLEQEQFGYQFPSAGDSKTVLVQRWVKRLLDGAGVVGSSPSPSTVQEALARRSEGDSIAARDWDAEEITPINNFSSNMRRIHFKPTLLSITVLNKLVSQCPFLDEIVFGGRDFSLSPEIWIILSTHCPILRVLRLQGYVFVPPEVPELILLFPRLEELEFTFAMFNKDPDIFNTLGDAFMEHKERHGSVHPLKVLYTSGKIMHPVRVLADLLALAVPTKIESLTVGGTNVPCSWYDRGTGSASERLPQAKRARYSFTGPWPSLDRLKHLDVSRVEMNDRNQLQKLYACFGDPSLHLRSLTVNINQLRNLISNDLYVLRLNNTNIPRGRDIKANLQVYRKMASEHCGFWFATVEKLTIRAQLQWFETAGDRGMNLFEARLVMAASPKVRWVDVRGVMGFWDTGVLASEMRVVGCCVVGDEEYLPQCRY